MFACRQPTDERLQIPVCDRHVWSTEGCNDLESCARERSPFEDHEPWVPTEPGLAQHVDLVFVPGEEARYTEPLPFVEPTSEADRISAHIIDLTSNDQTRVVRNPDETDPRCRFGGHDPNVPMGTDIDASRRTTAIRGSGRR